MGVLHIYYNTKTHEYFDMGKWYWCGGIDDFHADPITALMLPEDELAKEIDKYLSGENEPPPLTSDYAKWLAKRLVAFRGTGLSSDFEWLLDCESSYEKIYDCLTCGFYRSTDWMHKRHTRVCSNVDGKNRVHCSECHCEKPVVPIEVGSRYEEDWDGETYLKKGPAH